MPRSGDATLDDLLTQMRINNRLLAIQMQLRDAVRQKDLIELLKTTGATQQEIADVLGTSAAVVQVTLHRSRLKGKKQD